MLVFLPLLTRKSRNHTFANLDLRMGDCRVNAATNQYVRGVKTEKTLFIEAGVHLAFIPAPNQRPISILAPVQIDQLRS